MKAMSLGFTVHRKSVNTIAGQSGRAVAVRAPSDQIRAFGVLDSLVRSHPAKGFARMGVFGVFTGLGKAFWDLGFNRGRGNMIDSKRLKEAAGSEILDGGQKVIEGMRLTTGAGEPENGDRFGQGWSRFNDAGETLTSAFPNDSWAGEGADAYIDQNRTQAGRTNAVALLDRGVQTVIAREAYQVAYHRDKLDDQSNFLADLSYVTMALGLVPGYGKAMKSTVEAAAVQAALSICSLELYELSREANQNAAELHQAVGLYADAAATAPPPTRTGSPSPAPPPPPGGGAPPQGQVRQGPADGGRVVQAPATAPGPTPNSAASPQPPAAAQLPTMPAAPADGLAQLGAALAPLGALLAGAAQPAAQTPPAAPVAAPAAAKKSTKKKDDENQEDEDKAAPGRDEGEAERAPVDTEADADPALLHAPTTITLNADRPPTPPATTPQA